MYAAALLCCFACSLRGQVAVGIGYKAVDSEVPLDSDRVSRVLGAGASVVAMVVVSVVVAMVHVGGFVSGLR